MNPEERIQEHLEFLYGREKASEIWPRLEARLEAFQSKHAASFEHPVNSAAPLKKGSPGSLALTERDAVLITYADQFRRPGEPPLQTLRDFLDAHLEGALSAVHLLPFFPYSSDDGFSVVDYRQVDPESGGWTDIDRLGENYRLVFDAVINHISRRSAWFQGYLQGERAYRDYFIEISPDTDLSKVVRPRALPLLTPVSTSRGERHVWTTFSDDQIDLNYANPDVLVEIIDVLLFYVSKGAEVIRLDAIAYLWKEVGTTCIHLPQTHAVVKLWRAVLDAVAPNVILLTETNVPHEENISYFGERGDEAQMVYQFPLAPLILHAFLSGDARVLNAWAAGLGAPSDRTTFFNFIASHDGLGMRPAEGLLSPDELEAIVERTRAHGGQVSFKNNPDGSRSVYELNITLYDFLNDPGSAGVEVGVKRFLAAQAIMLSLAGVPGIYVHSLFGSGNCHECVEETGRARSINRQKFDLESLAGELSNPGSRAARVLAGYRKLLEQRSRLPAFHPASPQQVLDLHAGVFSVRRGEGDGAVVCLTSVSAEQIQVRLDLADLGLDSRSAWLDRLGRARYTAENGALYLQLVPFQNAWLAPDVTKD